MKTAAQLAFGASLFQAPDPSLHHFCLFLKSDIQKVQVIYRRKCHFERQEFVPWHAYRLEKVSVHSNSKERKCQRMFKLPQSWTHFICQQDHVQNPSSQASTARGLRASRCTSWIQKKSEEPKIKLPAFIGSQKKQENSRKTSTPESLTMLKPLTVWITTNCGKFLKR